MSPLDRVRARADAFSMLGISHGSEPEEIRAAWRRVAFEMHPDRHGGDQSGFIRAKGAYDFLLQDEAQAYSITAVAREASEVARKTFFRSRHLERITPRRPNLTIRNEALPPAVLEACRDLLVSNEEEPSWKGATFAAQMRLQEDAPHDAEDGMTDHVADSIERKGRRVTYVFTTVLMPGINRVAVPTAILETPRRPRPDLLSIATRSLVDGDIMIPDAICSQLFPGAKTVSLRFGEAPRVEAPDQP